MVRALYKTPGTVKRVCDPFGLALNTSGSPGVRPASCARGVARVHGRDPGGARGAGERAERRHPALVRLRLPKHHLMVRGLYKTRFNGARII